MTRIVPLLLIACTTSLDVDNPPDTADTAPEPTPITILGHCPGFTPGTAPPAVTITGHDACATVYLTSDQDAWVSELEVCGGYGEYGAFDGITPGTTGLSCEMFEDWGNGGERIAVSMVVDGVCFGYGAAEWCP